MLTFLILLLIMAFGALLIILNSNNVSDIIIKENTPKLVEELKKLGYIESTHYDSNDPFLVASNIGIYSSKKSLPLYCIYFISKNNFLKEAKDRINGYY